MGSPVFFLVVIPYSLSVSNLILGPSEDHKKKKTRTKKKQIEENKRNKQAKNEESILQSTVVMNLEFFIEGSVKKK